MGCNFFELSRKDIKYYLFLTVYVVIIYYLMMTAYSETFRQSYYGLLFVYSFNAAKCVLAIGETIIIFWLTVKKTGADSLSEKIMFLLNLLYFIPGTIQQAVTNADIKYMLFFFLFWMGMEAWLMILKPNNISFIPKEHVHLKRDTYLLVITVFAFVVIEYIAIHYGQVFSVSNIKATLGDVYGVRAASKEAGMHWILVCLEYFSVYFLILMITYYTEKKKWIIVGLCGIAEISAFLVQANRIIPFLAALAFVMGLIKVDNKMLCFAFAVLAVILFIEVRINIHGLSFTNVYRRYSIVPNRLSEQYFDFFRTHTPDFLRSKYTRFSGWLGMKSEYLSPSIGMTIGRVYYDADANCNTGLVGGGAFMFGLAAPVITTFGYCMAYRIFELASSGMKDTRVVNCMALVLATLSINTGTMLANIFSISYIMLLCLSLVFAGALSGNMDAAGRVASNG